MAHVPFGQSVQAFVVLSTADSLEKAHFLRGVLIAHLHDIYPYSNLCVAVHNVDSKATSVEEGLKSAHYVFAMSEIAHGQVCRLVNQSEFSKNLVSFSVDTESAWSESSRNCWKGYSEDKFLSVVWEEENIIDTVHSLCRLVCVAHRLV